MFATTRTTHTHAFVPEVGAIPFPGYQLHSLRGRGGFATVWEATDPHGERIAMKFMSCQTGHVAAREIRSLQAIQALRHPHLSRIRDVWSMHGYIVIAMDLADATLLDLMLLYHDDLHRCIEPEKLCLYMIQVAQALDYLNARRHLVDGRMVGYQHGDIKPNNILLTGDLAQLADYGLATPTSGGNTPCPRQGTIEYAAPEVFQGYLTETSDQFSLAVMYFVLRTGAFPFPPPPDPKNVVMRGYQRPQPDLSLMPNAERAIVQRALSPIPQNRFSNCTEFVYAILTVQDLKFVRGDEKSYVVRVPPSSSEFKMAGIK